MRYVLCLAAVLFATAGARADDEALQQRRFDLAYRDATVFARNARTEECRAALLALRGPLLAMSPAAQGKRAGTLIRALESVGETGTGRALRVELVKQRKEAARIAAAEQRQRLPEEEARDLFATAVRAHQDAAMRRSLLSSVATLLTRVPAPSPESVFARGVCELELGDLAAARKDLEAAAPLISKNVGPTYALARLARLQGDRVGAATLLEKGLAQEVTADGLQLLVSELTDLKTEGKSGEAETRARDWLGRAGSAEGADGLWAFVGKLDEDKGKLELAFGETLHASTAWSAGPATSDAVRLGRKLEARGAGSRQAILKHVEELVAADSTAPSDLLLLAGDLEREDENLARALAYYGAGLKGQEPARFALALEALKPAVKAKGQPELVQQLDRLLEKPAPTQLAEKPEAAPANPGVASPAPETAPPPGEAPSPGEPAPPSQAEAEAILRLKLRREGLSPAAIARLVGSGGRIR